MKKCAIYTRVSTSMQAEKEYNSCEAQKDRISGVHVPTHSRGNLIFEVPNWNLKERVQRPAPAQLAFESYKIHPRNLVKMSWRTLDMDLLIED